MNESREGKIIVIDDDHSACNLISRTLEAEGLEVIIASDPENALEKTRQIKPDLIFISLLSFGSEGISICKSIHAVKGFEKVPVIMLIPYSGELDPRYAATVGIVDVMVKPLDKDELVSKTLNILDKPVVESKTGRISDETSVEEDLSPFPVEEKPGDSEPIRAVSESFNKETAEQKEDFDDRAADESLKKDLLEQKEDYADRVEGKLFSEEALDQKEDYADNGLDEDLIGRNYRHHRKTRKRRAKKSLLFYVVALIFAGLGVGLLLFAGIDEKLIGFIFDETPGKEETVQEETITGSLPADMVKTDEISPSSDIDKSEDVSREEGTVQEETTTELLPAGEIEKEEITPPVSSDRPKAVQKKRRPPPKSEFLKKQVYSIQVGAFGNESNALSLIDKLKQKGYKGFILRQSRLGRKALHRVLIGKFDRRKDALESSKILLQKEGIKSFVYSY
ncbi:MAG: response regulator [Thermodesulfovibrionia bacterium]